MTPSSSFNTPSAAASSGTEREQCNKGIRDAYATYAKYIRAATTKDTKLISAGSGTQRRVLASNTARQLITVNTVRRQGESPMTGEADFVETMPVPPPTDRGGILGYVVHNTELANHEPTAEDIGMPESGGRTNTRHPYGKMELLNVHEPKWGFAPLMQHCVQQWVFRNCTALVRQGMSQAAAEQQFAASLPNRLEPEQLGRSMLVTSDAASEGNPFEPLHALARQLENRDDRLLLYRGLGLEIMKMTYAMRLRHLQDPRGAGLRPTQLPHEDIDLLKTARAHMELDSGVRERALAIHSGVQHRLISIVKTAYRGSSESSR